MLKSLPASFFGMVLGLAGLANAWRIAHQLWGMPAVIGEAIMALAAVVWAVLMVLFAGKWLFARSEALEEARHPVQCCFIGLAGVATLLISLGVAPYSRLAEESLFVLGALFTLGFAAWRSGLLWQGGREPAATTPVLYFPTVAGGFVTAAAATALGYQQVGEIAFGAGLLSWLAIESVLLHRLYTLAPLPEPLRPTLGVTVAPPAVGSVAYVALTHGHPDMVAHALIGYGLLQTLIVIRLLPWVMKQPFSASYWSFSFGATALAAAPMRLAVNGDGGVIAFLAPILFWYANIVVGLVALGTLGLIARGRLLPRPVAAVAAPSGAR